MIKILMDSASDCPKVEAEKMGMEIVSLQVSIAGQEFLDGVNLEKNHFYELLRETGEFPKTSQPSPQEFCDIFEKIKENGDELICILLSSALSGTYQSAVIAKEMVEYDKIYLIDSLSASYAIQILASHASQLIKKGKSALEVVREVEALKWRIKIFAALDTLEYLARGGRISKTVATLGGMVNLKPVITVKEDGTVGLIGKCLGKNKATNFILQRLKEFGVDERFPVQLIYSYGEENCKKLQERVEKEGYCVSERGQIGTAIGAHVGPEAFGVIVVTK